MPSGPSALFDIMYIMNSASIHVYLEDVKDMVSFLQVHIVITQPYLLKFFVCKDDRNIVSSTSENPSSERE